MTYYLTERESVLNIPHIPDICIQSNRLSYLILEEEKYIDNWKKVPVKTREAHHTNSSKYLWHRKSVFLFLLEK